MRKLKRLIADFVLFWDMRALLLSLQIRTAARKRVTFRGFFG